MKQKRIKKSLLTFGLICAVSAGLLAGLPVLPRFLSWGENAALISAGILLPQGGTALALAELRGDALYPQSEAISDTPVVVKADSIAPSPSEPVTSAPPLSTPVPQPPVPEEKKGKILEEQFKRIGQGFGNVFVKNSNAEQYAFDVEKKLKAKPDFKYQKGKVQVLIVHTHTTEAFESQDLGYYIKETSMRTTDKAKSIVAVGDKIAQQLEAAGIGVVHDSTYHDYPGYNGAYGRSEVTIQNYLKKYPSISVVIDVHRDAITRSGGVRVKPTAVINNQKSAQVMIITGTDNGGKLKFPDWEYNLRFALQWQQQMETNAPHLTRPVDFCARRYNMHLTRNSVLLEVGSEANTLDEALYAGELAGKALADVLIKLK